MSESKRELKQTQSMSMEERFEELEDKIDEVKDLVDKKSIELRNEILILKQMYLDIKKAT